MAGGPEEHLTVSNETMGATNRARRTLSSSSSETSEPRIAWYHAPGSALSVMDAMSSVFPVRSASAKNWVDVTSPTCRSKPSTGSFHCGYATGTPSLVT